MTQCNWLKVRAGDIPPDTKILAPVDEFAADILAAHKDGKEFSVQVKGSRNPKHHRLFFAMLGEIVKAGAWPGDVDSLLDWIKFKCFHVRTVMVGDEKRIVPKSIRFDAMTQQQFKNFFDRAMFHICTDLLSEANWQKFRDDMINQLESRYRDPRDVQ